VKIIEADSLNRENWNGDQRLVAAQIESLHLAQVICDALNAGRPEHSERYYKIVPDDHVLREFKP
jgi:hypothetical protein